MKRILVQGLMVAVLACSGAAQAASYSSMFVFGDSLSDSGNNALLIGATVPSAVITGDSYYSQVPYSPAGTYSNGPVWATHVAASLGLSVAPSGLPSLPGFPYGTNYAFGGAQTGVDGSDIPAVAGFPFSMKTQVNMFLGATGGHAPSDALYVVAGGGNNVRVALEAIGADPTLSPAAIGAIVAGTAYNYGQDVAQIVNTLQGAGAQHILVWNTPNFGLTPLALSGGAAASALATGLSYQMNLSLDAALTGETGLMRFDMFSFLSGTVQNAAAEGLTDVTHACGAAINACDVSTALFWDAIHPTALGHQLLANGVNATLAAAVPEPSSYALMAVGLLAIGWRARSKRR